VAVALACTALASGSAAGKGKASLKPPRPTAPAPGVAHAATPAFGWTPVRGAEHYEFAVAADPSFSSPVAQGFTVGPIVTGNTWATLTKLIPNGTYWWHVRAVGKGGAVSLWSRPRLFRRVWKASPALLSPANGAVIRYPKTILELRWSPVPYAAKYLVWLATDPGLGNLWSGKPIETQATSYVPSGALKEGTYYWAVTPLDAQGNRGVRSRVASFRWMWPSATAPRMTDLAGAAELFDPLFSWSYVPGAARYEIEINSSQDFAPGSKVCCDQPFIGTSFAPTTVLKNNRYYWRVRAVDVDGNAGQWNLGKPFTKFFDTVPPVAGTSIKRLRVRDNLGDRGASPPGFATSSPIVVWDPVPGASSYQVEVVPFNSPLRPNDCDWTSRSEHWLDVTATPAWTPLGTGMRGTSPFPTSRRPSGDQQAPKPGRSYCVRVRAQTDRDFERREVWGDYTYLPNAFTFTGFAAGFGSPIATPSDYLEPARGSVSRRTPLFTWRAIPGAASYFVLVAKDPSFTNVVDYAFTQIPAYAPREGADPMTYADETTLYYWAVLPAPRLDGAGAAGDPLLNGPAPFQKRSIPATPILPKDNVNIVGPVSFLWTPVEGARRYRLQVARDRNFGGLLDEVVTGSTAYTSTKIYPADVALYWRVRAEDENLVGLTWSPVRKFRNLLPAPVPSPKNPSRGDTVPTWTWSAVKGAVSYDFHAEQPDGRTRDFSNIRANAATPVEMTGTGVFHWQVRAQFPQSIGTVPGPYSRRVSFARTIDAPAGARQQASPRGVLLRWEPKPGAKAYRVEISSSPDFARTGSGETVTTDNTSYAPQIGGFGYSRGGTFYWRVAAVDSASNVGSFTQPKSFKLPAKPSFRAPKLPTMPKKR